MRTLTAWMLVGTLLALVASTGCQPKTVEPVVQAPAPEPVLEAFPEDQVPEPEPQPVASEPAPPVDTAAPKAKTAAPPKAQAQPKESYAAKASAKAARTYVVRKGDTLQKISKRFYGTTRNWRRIYEANRDVLADGPDKIQIGMKLRIP